MPDAWILITLGAVVFQSTRTAIQKRVSGDFSHHASNFARFFFALPFAAVLALVVWGVEGETRLAVPHGFFAYVFIAGVTQILGGWFMLAAFSSRNFAVGITLSKTEAVQTALFETILLNARFGMVAILPILMSGFGVLLISVGRLRGRAGMRDMVSVGALYGILCGAMYGIVAVAMRGAALSLGDASGYLRGSLTLLAVLALESSILGLYLAWHRRGELKSVFSRWRQTAVIGVVGAGGSACWAIAVSLQSAAAVKALGQVEILIAIAVSRFFFREKATLMESLGIVAVVVGVVILLFAWDR